MKHLGMNFESIFFNRVEESTARRFVEMGADRALFRLVVDRFMPKKGEFKTAELEADIRAFINAGIRHITIVRQSVPFWATVDQTKSHHTYEDGCMSLGEKGERDRDVPYKGFTEHKPHCAKITHVILEEMYYIGRTVMQFLRETFADDDVEFRHCTGPNEPTQKAYNVWEHEASTEKITVEQAVRNVVDEQMVPYWRGIRSVDPAARFLWLEADAAHTVRFYLPYMIAKKLIREGDAIGAHFLPWDPERTWKNAYERGLEMYELIQKLLPGFPVECTEASADPEHPAPISERIEFTAKCLALPFVDALYWHDHQAFTDDALFNAMRTFGQSLNPPDDMPLPPVTDLLRAGLNERMSAHPFNRAALLVYRAAFEDLDTATVEEILTEADALDEITRVRLRR